MDCSKYEFKTLYILNYFPVNRNFNPDSYNEKMKNILGLILVLFALSVLSCNVNSEKSVHNNISGQWVLEFKRDGQIPGQYFIWKFEPLK